MSMQAEKIIENISGEAEIPKWMREQVLERYHLSIAAPSRGEPLDVVFNRLLTEFPPD